MSKYIRLLLSSVYFLLEGKAVQSKRANVEYTSESEESSSSSDDEESDSEEETQKERKSRRKRGKKKQVRS